MKDSKFARGDVVRLNDFARENGIRLAKGERSGRITGFSREGLPRVRWDGYVDATLYSPDYLMLEAETEKP